MRLRACARRTEGHAFGLRLAVGDHFLNGLERRLRIDHQEQRRHDRHRHRLQILAIVVQLLEQRFGCRKRRSRIEHRVSVRCGARDQFIGDAGARARLVLDDELLVQAAPKLLGENPQRDVAGPAGPIRRNQPHDARRPVALGARLKDGAGSQTGDGPQQGSACDGHQCLRKSGAAESQKQPGHRSRFFPPRARALESPGFSLEATIDLHRLSDNVYFLTDLSLLPINTRQRVGYREISRWRWM